MSIKGRVAAAAYSRAVAWVGALGFLEKLLDVFGIILAFCNALTATAILNAPAIKSKCANIHRNAFFLFFVLADWFFFHALPDLHRRISFSPRLFIRSLHVAMQIRLYLQPCGCRVLVSASLQVLQYAVSRYTFRSLPRSARLGIVHRWSSTEFSRFMGLFFVVCILLFHSQNRF